MKEVYVRLQTVEEVHSFVKAINPLKGDFELVSGSYVLDARSLMGIFAFDLTKPILLKVYNDSEENMKAVEPFIIKGDE